MFKIEIKGVKQLQADIDALTKTLSKSHSVSIPSGEKGYTGRECQKPNCSGYFKIKLGTGLKGNNLPCHCPYCGHVDSHDNFFTKEQIEYAKSIALNRCAEAIDKFLKTKGRLHPIRFYGEKTLETEVNCEKCALEYMIYGVFGFCPDCGIHNSLQIFNKNLDLIQKMVVLASSQESAIAEQLIVNALEDCVSSFDAFGRAICKTRAKKAEIPEQVKTLSFQNIERAKGRIKELFGFDFSQGLDSGEWALIVRSFQKRHSHAHKMGVVDRTYLDLSGDSFASLGRKIQIQPDEVTRFVEILRRIANDLSKNLNED